MTNEISNVASYDDEVEAYWPKDFKIDYYEKRLEFCFSNLRSLGSSKVNFRKNLERFWTARIVRYQELLEKVNECE